MTWHRLGHCLCSKPCDAPHCVCPPAMQRSMTTYPSCPPSPLALSRLHSTACTTELADWLARGWLAQIFFVTSSYTAWTRSDPRFTTATSIEAAYGTGASSMQSRFTGASSRSKHCSLTIAEMVAPTPPE